MDDGDGDNEDGEDGEDKGEDRRHPFTALKLGGE